MALTGETQVLQGSLRSIPHWTTHIVEIKPQLKPRDTVSKEEDPKPSHQLYKLRKNPPDQLGRLCVNGIYKMTLIAPTKENALVLIAVGIGGKNTQE